MKKETKIIIGLSIAALVIVAILFYVRYRGLKNEIEAEAAPQINNSGAVINAGGSTSTSPTAPVSQPYHGSNISQWKKGDKLFCLAGVVNIYKTPLASQSNIVKSVTPQAEHFANVSSVLSSGFVAVNYITFSYLGFPYVQTGYIFPNNGNVSN